MWAVLNHRSALTPSIHSVSYTDSVEVARIGPSTASGSRAALKSRGLAERPAHPSKLNLSQMRVRVLTWPAIKSDLPRYCSLRGRPSILAVMCLLLAPQLDHFCRGCTEHRCYCHTTCVLHRRQTVDNWVHCFNRSWPGHLRLYGRSAGSCSGPKHSMNSSFSWSLPGDLGARAGKTDVWTGSHRSISCTCGSRTCLVGARTSSSCYV